MSEVRAETNPSDEKLREYILPDDLLKSNEAKHPGQVRLIALNRYSARLLVNSETVVVDLKKGRGEYRALTLRNRSEQPDRPIELWELMWHKAAEAMLAVRKGHMEIRRNRRLKAEPIEAGASA